MSAQSRAIARALTRVVERVSRAIAINVSAELQRVNPVDTGWSRANWMASAGRTARPRFVPDTVRISQSSHAARMAAVSKADAFRQTELVSALTFRLGMGVLWVANSVPYMRQLAAGSSSQAPAGWVRASVIRGVSRSVRSLHGQSFTVRG